MDESRGFEPVETHGCLRKCQNGAFFRREARVNSLVALIRPFSVGSMNPGGVRVPSSTVVDRLYMWTVHVFVACEDPFSGSRVKRILVTCECCSARRL